MAKKCKNRYSTAEEMLTDLNRVAAGEPPLVARQHYDLSSLADLEKGAKESASHIQSRVNAIPLAAQETMDVDARSFKERLLDPLVLGLAAVSILMAVILAIVLMVH
jgi:hypothetical protein